MSILSPDVIDAINKVASTPLGRKYDRMARAKYHVSGPALAAKQVKGESGGNRKAVSPAGARGLSQFMPGTRDEVLKESGYDAYGSDADAIAALMTYDLKRGVAGYNPGMASYVQYILDQKIGPMPSLKRNGAKGGSFTIESPQHTSVTRPTTTIPGQSFQAERDALKSNLFLSGNKLSMQSLLNYKQQANQLKDIPAQTVPGELQIKQTGGKPIKVKTKAAGPEPLGGGGTGSFKITGPDPGRLQSGLVKYANKVARIYGGPLTGSDGASHSKYTVNGNVSEHYSGRATDIPLTGHELVRAGQAALIAAGMPRAKALKQTGGLYNVGNHQIIFNVDGVQYGGNHLDHLHISSH